MKIAVTGANSSVGQNLIAHILIRGNHEVIAGVRSLASLKDLPVDSRIEPRVIRYDDVDGLAEAISGADSVVHLAGILIESKQSNYQTANVDATEAVIKAARKAKAKHLVFVSVVGANSDSSNPYFRSKGQAEKLVEQSGLSASILRTPILLGPGTAGALSLVGAASQARVGILGGGHYQMQPLDVNDLSTAILRCCGTPNPGAKCFELVGPETVSYRDLVTRVAGLMGKNVAIKSIPIWMAKLGAAVNSRIKGGGITPAVIDVITQGEKVAHNSDDALGITLTPLNETLEKIVNQS
ncbi:MAG: NAD(P)H-binding protein [Pseudohongiellaceae bacterium]